MSFNKLTFSMAYVFFHFVKTLDDMANVFIRHGNNTFCQSQIVLLLCKDGHILPDETTLFLFAKRFVVFLVSLIHHCRYVVLFTVIEQLIETIKYILGWTSLVTLKFHK